MIFYLYDSIQLTAPTNIFFSVASRISTIDFCNIRSSNLYSLILQLLNIFYLYNCYLYYYDPQVESQLRLRS